MVAAKNKLMNKTYVFCKRTNLSLLSVACSLYRDSVLDVYVNMGSPYITARRGVATLGNLSSNSEYVSNKTIFTPISPLLSFTQTLLDTFLKQENKNKTKNQQQQQQQPNHQNKQTTTTISRRRMTERARSLGRRTRQEMGKGNQPTALRIPESIRHPRPPFEGKRKLSE